MKKSKVLLVSPFPPPFGGIASYSQNLFEGLKKNGINILKYDTISYEKLRFYNPDNKRNYIRLFHPLNILFTIAVTFDWFIFGLFLIIKNPRIIHVHTSSYWGWWRSVIYILISKMLLKKTILHIHNAIDRFYYEESRQFYQSLIRKSLKYPDHIVTLSSGIKELVSKLTDKPITTIYNGVSVEKFENIKQFQKPYKILFAGFVGPQKGVPDLLKGLNHSDLKKEEVVLTLMGKGDISEMFKIANDLGLREQIEFTGLVSEERKIELFKTHHILALPSYGEGQPISIIEGLASGMAILSTKVGSIPEIIKQSVNGILVDRGDIKQIGNAIKKLVSNESELIAISKRNRILAVEKFNFKRVINNNINIYNSLQ